MDKGKIPKGYKKSKTNKKKLLTKSIGFFDTQDGLNALEFVLGDHKSERSLKVDLEGRQNGEFLGHPRNKIVGVNPVLNMYRVGQIKDKEKRVSLSNSSYLWSTLSTF